MYKVVNPLYLAHQASEWFVTLAANYPNLREIKGKWINEKSLRALGTIGSSALTSVEFTVKDITQSGIYMLCKGNPSLKCLVLPGSKLTDESVRSIVNYCPGMENLSIENWVNLSNSSLELLGTLTSLKSINLAGCKGLTSAGILALIRRIGANLEVLKLCSEFGICSANKVFTGYALLQSIGECCPKLRELAVSLRSNLNITEAIFAALFQGCPLLETFLGTCLTDAALLCLAQNCPCLREIVLFEMRCTDAGIAALAKGCTCLKSLRLHLALQLTDASIFSLAEYCKGIEVLSLSCPVQITDHALSQLFRSCPQLASIKLFGAPSITDVAMYQLLESCTQLTALALSRVPLITDQSIEASISGCPRLKEVALFDRDCITVKTIIGLAGLPELEFLEVESCPTFSDDAIRLIARNCKRLKYIKLNKCPLITVQAVVALLTYGKRLSDICISSCHESLTPEIVASSFSRGRSTYRVGLYLDGHACQV